MLHDKLRNRTCQGLDRQGQGQGQGPSLQGQGLDLQGQGHKFGPWTKINITLWYTVNLEASMTDLRKCSK